MVDEHTYLRSRLNELRDRLEAVFTADTAVPGIVYPATGSPAGHCAIVAKLLHDKLGGEFVSARVDGVSHWFNRLIDEGVWVDVDITGDQFHGERVRIGRPGKLWPDTDARSQYDLDVSKSTLDRYALLCYRLSARFGPHAANCPGCHGVP